MLSVMNLLLRIAVGACLLAQTAPVLAVLGEAALAPLLPSAPVATKSMATTSLPNPQPASKVVGLSYQTLEIQLDNGTAVKEFATLQGRVFAVSWRGPVLPDLSSWLGTHFPSFVRAAEQARSEGVRHSTLNLSREGLVMRSNGRMRAFEGFAYLPALVPAGVVIDDVLQ